MSEAVKQGYKQTELGVIPEDWAVETVKNAYQIRNDLRLPLSRTVREGISGVYPYYGPTGIQGWINEFRVTGKFALIGEDGDHFLKWESQSMTLLIEGKYNVNNHAHLVKGETNLTEWFYWYFKNRDITQSLTRQGASRYKLTKAALEQLNLPLPPLPEQRAIASALADMDALLASLEELLTKKRQLKQAAMQELLTGKTRLEGFEGEWEEKRLGDVAAMSSGGTPDSKNPAFYGGQISWASIADMSNTGKFLTRTEKTLSQLGYQSSAARIFKPPTVLFAMYASIGKTCICNVSLATSQAILGIECSQAVLVEFLYYWLVSKGDYLRTLGQQGTQANLNKGIVQDLVIPLPNLPEQKAIAAILSAMDAELEALEGRVTKTRDLKQGMMQELLTGRTRLL